MSHQQFIQAVTCTQYGEPEVLQLITVEKPTPQANEILIKNLAATVNSGDIRVRGLRVNAFTKIIMKLVLGFRKPRKSILGVTFSGVVEQVGNQVTKYKVGDEIFGMTGFRFGTYSEYILITEKTVALPLPQNATHEQAAAIPFGATTAMYFLEKSGIFNHKNSKILIYGSSGSVGTAAVEIAKSLDVELTVVCSSANTEFMQSLGVNHIVNYDSGDLSSQLEQYDVIFDAVGKTKKSKMSKFLKKNGKFLTVGGLDVAPERQKDLEYVTDLFSKGRYIVSIDKTYKLSELPEAHRYVETERKRGNVVITISHD